jgi:heme-degrading monooxygenase HmoA
MTHHRIWKFRPPEGREAEFENAYSSTGDWVQLFRKAPGFQRTILLRPSEPNGWWLTIDQWDDQASFEAFTEVFGEQYRALDAELEGVAGEEQFVGTFED